MEDMKQYIGMKFQDWCALDEDDERPMYMSLFILQTKQSYSFRTGERISEIEQFLLSISKIKDIILEDGKWFIELILE